MKIPFSKPDPLGSERARASKKYRDMSTEISRLRPQALTLLFIERKDREFQSASYLNFRPDRSSIDV